MKRDSAPDGARDGGVVFLDPVGTLGGAERSLLDLIASLRVAAPELRAALVVGSEGPLVCEAERLGATVTVVPLPRDLSRVGDSALSRPFEVARRAPVFARAAASLASYGAELRRAVIAQRPAVVHSNGMKMHLLSALMPLRGIPVVWHLRDFVGQRAVMQRVLRVVAARAHGLVAISKSVAEDAARVLGGRDATVVYNAIDTEAFTPEGERIDLDALAGLPAPNGAPVVRVGLVATYAHWKGQDLFLDAAARIHRARGSRVAPAVRFYVIGGRTYETEASQFSEEELRAAIAARGLAGVAGLVPFQASPQKAFRALDVVVHASTRPEPFGRTIAEAMACGRAMVTAKEGGAAELVKDGVDAVAVPPRDAAALAGAIEGLAADTEKRERIGRAARATAEGRFARARLGPEVLAVYRSLGVTV